MKTEAGYVNCHVLLNRIWTAMASTGDQLSPCSQNMAFQVTSSDGPRAEFKLDLFKGQITARQAVGPLFERTQCCVAYIPRDKPQCIGHYGRR